VLKYGHLGLQGHDVNTKSPVHEHCGQHNYRSPSQCDRDHVRAFRWHSSGFTNINTGRGIYDSGIATPGREGVFSFSTNDRSFGKGKSHTEQSNHADDMDTCGRANVVNFNFDVDQNTDSEKGVSINIPSHRDMCVGTQSGCVEVVDKEVQCTPADHVGAAATLVDRGVQYEAVYLSHIGVQCTNGCEQTPIQTNNVGTQCKTVVPKKSKRLQTDRPMTTDAAITCIPKMVDNFMQTLKTGKIVKKMTASSGCQTEMQTVSRHSQVFVKTSNIKTQTTIKTSANGGGSTSFETMTVSKVGNTKKTDTLASYYVCEGPTKEGSKITFDTEFCKGNALCSKNKHALSAKQDTTPTTAKPSAIRMRLQKCGFFSAYSDPEFNPG
jgi:hypothetical protein